MINVNSEKTKEKIKETLKLHPEGLTIQNLSDILKLHRQTVAKYVLVLEAAGELVIRRIGSVTLCYLKETFAQIQRLKK